MTGCCTDKSCTPETCMNLPDSKTCGECVHIKRCIALGVATDSSTSCDFFPRRFMEKEHHQIKEYDLELCITAAELRQLGYEIPEDIPDAAWIPRGSMVHVGEPDCSMDEKSGIVEMIQNVNFTQPFRWVKVNVNLKKD